MSRITPAEWTVEQDGLRLVAAVEFDAEGLPVAVVADRFRDVGGEGVLTRWSGHFRDWKELGGRPFPSAWESVWHLPEGELSVVQMEILAVETE
jgi:hypothetical protein